MKHAYTFSKVPSFPLPFEVFLVKYYCTEFSDKKGGVLMNFDMILGLIIVPLTIIGLGVAAFIHTGQKEGESK